MKVILARTAGFCMGVKRALELVLKAINEDQPEIYTYGPLIHNPQVLDLLKERGISVLKPGESASRGLVVIRAHGVPPQEREQLEAAGAHIIDATCPRVARVQAIIRRWARQDYATLILGDADHPEVRGLLGHTQARGHVVSDPEDVAALPAYQDVIVVAQTTQSEAHFDLMVGEIKRRFRQCYLPEYWERLFLLSGATPDPERLRALRSIVLVCVIEGDEATGAFRTSAEVRRSLKLVDAQGRDYLPIAPDSMDAMTETYARILENDFANSMGELGTHLHVYVFKAVDADGKPVIDPQKSGSFAVETDVARYEWQLPWACLAPLRLCPVDGEVMTGPWEYCPRHGVELKAAPSWDVHYFTYIVY